jgi:CheY-like chemotaxis protein
MSLLLSEVGYRVRSAADGFAALREIRQEAPDILVSDLNMAGMSGFELLAVVWRRYPTIHKVAMSGAFCGNEVPSGVAADAFYQKGSSIGALLMILESLPQKEHQSCLPYGGTAQRRNQRSRLDFSPAGTTTIACPECLREFAPRIRGTNGLTCETECIHCGHSIQYTIADSLGSTNQQEFQVKQDGTPSALISPSLSN